MKSLFLSVHTETFLKVINISLLPKFKCAVTCNIGYSRTVDKRQKKIE